MTVDDYIAAAPDVSKARLTRLRAMAKEAFPQAEEIISYRMPAYRQGRVFLYFAAFKNHIGIYPPVGAPASLVTALARHRGPKGNLQFRHDEDMPSELISRVMTALHRAHAIRT
jgi:uncharacterized protein YdhG (YjbR/CyaY superfamily)